jgi:putative dehydrogenase
LTVMASGTAAAFEKARPVLNAMATTVYELGSSAGIGASFKMVNQLLAGVHIAAACEAMTFAKKLGLDLPTVFKVITASAGNSWMFENRVPHILDGDYSAHGQAREVSLADCSNGPSDVPDDCGIRQGTG